jgi:hypothetical protein
MGITGVSLVTKKLALFVQLATDYRLLTTA